ncbi:uncharacterized protein LOC135203476 [Macrobrachium nipponense]|uniref:uncharacterized protein LOC135203476 n=1 Tax=Macrobrachium nipponense TaxID=159736 RepID=UPI0030C82F8B
MATTTQIKIDHFNSSQITLDLWLSLLEANFSNLGIEEDMKKKNVLLVLIGTDVFSALGSLCAPDLPHTKTYDDLVAVLKSHYIVKPYYHRSLIAFQQRKKRRDETVNSLYADLKALAKDCNFGNHFDSRDRDQLFMAVDNEVYFPNLVALYIDLQAMTSSAVLERILNMEKVFVFKRNESQPQVKASNSRAEGKKAVETIGDYEDNIDDRLLMVKGKVFALNSDEFYFSINHNLVPFEIDSGAAVSTITKDTKVSQVFYVVDSCNTNLCGKDSMQQVGIYLAGIDEGTRVIKVAKVSAEKLLDNDLVDSSKPITGILAKIHLKGNATPKFMKARTVPFYYMRMIEVALDKLVADEMMEPISHSEWVVPVVPVLKENKVEMRICGDFKVLNKQIHFDRLPLPKIEELLSVVG